MGVQSYREGIVSNKGIVHESYVTFGLHLPVGSAGRQGTR